MLILMSTLPFSHLNVAASHPRGRDPHVYRVTHVNTCSMIGTTKIHHPPPRPCPGKSLMIPIFESPLLLLLPSPRLPRSMHLGQTWIVQLVPATQSGYQFRQQHPLLLCPRLLVVFIVLVSLTKPPRSNAYHPSSPLIKVPAFPATHLPTLAL